MILYHAADLLWATRIKKTGESAGISCRPVRSPDMLQARLVDSDVRALVVDLDAPGAALDLIRALRAAEGQKPRERPTKVLAFGPHIAVEAFQSAREAGADIVMARGAFDRGLDRILIELDGDGPDGD